MKLIVMSLSLLFTVTVYKSHAQEIDPKKIIAYCDDDGCVHPQANRHYSNPRKDKNNGQEPYTAPIKENLAKANRLFQAMRDFQEVADIVKNSPADPELDALLQDAPIAPTLEYFVSLSQTERELAIDEFIKHVEDVKQHLAARQQASEADIDALINEQNFAQQYEQLSEKQKSELREGPSWVTIWFEETIASLFEIFPSLEDSTLALVEKYPFLLEWYAKYYEYMYPEPETIDIAYEPDITIEDEEDIVHVKSDETPSEETANSDHEL